MFLFAVPVGALAFGLTFLLKELPLRETTRAVDRADSTAPTAVPATRDSAQEMERALLTLFGREHRAEVYRRLAEAADVQISPRGCWLLYRIADNGPISEAALARLLGITSADLKERMTEPVAAGYISVGGDGAQAGGDGAQPSRDGAQPSRDGAQAGGDGAQPSRDDAQPSRDGAQPSRDGATVALTPAGKQAADRLNDAREAGIGRLMTGWEPDRNPELRQLLRRITKKLVATDGPPAREAAAAPAAPQR